MGGDDSQKLLPWRGTLSSPGRSRPPAHYEINTVMDNDFGPRRAPRQGDSATNWVGHFGRAQGGQFSKAPKPKSPRGPEHGDECCSTQARYSPHQVPQTEPSEYAPPPN